MHVPRKAREKIHFGTYLIQQTCIPEKKIFESDMDREEFLKIIEDKKKQFNFRIYGYCLADDNKYKLIIYDNGSDISKIMKSINISLAYYIKDRGKIFNERYKSTLIKTPEILEDVLNNLHNHEHCCEYDFNKAKEIIDCDVYFTPYGSTTEKILYKDKFTNEVCMKINPNCKNTSNCIRDINQGKEVLKLIADKYDITIDEFLSDKKLRNQELLKFRRVTTLSLNDIGLLFGGLSESAVCKIISRSND